MPSFQPSSLVLRNQVYHNPEAAQSFELTDVETWPVVGPWVQESTTEPNRRKQFVHAWILLAPIAALGEYGVSKSKSRAAIAGVFSIPALMYSLVRYYAQNR